MTHMNIGDILVVPKGTKNPYGKSVLGDERSEALRLFLTTETPPTEHDFWYGPASGGARKLASKADANVDPETLEYYWGEKGIRT